MTGKEVYDEPLQSLDTRVWQHNQTVCNGGISTSGLARAESADWSEPHHTCLVDHLKHDASHARPIDLFPDLSYIIPECESTTSYILKQPSAASDSSRVVQDRIWSYQDEVFSGATALPQKANNATHPIQCWLHNCNGRSFTYLSNYRRHCREKSRLHSRSFCSLCGKHFTRKAAWKAHVEQQRCKFVDYDDNGIPFERKRHAIRHDTPSIDSQ